MKRTSRSSSKYASQTGVKESVLKVAAYFGEEGGQGQGGGGDGLDVALDERPGYAVGVSPSHDGVGVGAVDGPAVVHRLSAHRRRQLGGVVEGEREDLGAEGAGAGLFGVAVCGGLEG